MADEKSVTITMVKDKECKYSVRYVSPQHQVATNVYLSKQWLGTTYPKAVQVTITKED